MFTLFVAAAEELFFRGLLLPAFVRRLKSRWVALLAVSGLFSLLHCLNFTSGMKPELVLLQVFLAFLGGLVLGRLWLRWGLLPCVAAHVLINLGPVPLYIDPGTGSMLFTILIGLLGVLRYLCRSWFIRAKFLLSGGRRAEHSDRVPLVIFSDDKRYWQIFQPICEELGRRNFPVRYLTMSQDDGALEAEYAGFTAEYIGSDNRAFAKLNFLNGVMLLSTTPGLEVYQWKRSPEVDWYIHLPHASSDVTLYHMFGIDYYDALLLSGEYQVEQVRALEALRHLPAKELQLVGLPYMDVMEKRATEGAYSPSLHSAHYTLPTILLAPSWGKSGLLSKFGPKVIDALLATGYHLIIRPHPQSFASEKELMAQLQAKYPASEQLEWNRDRDNFQVLGRADILISDFSGVIFDYALIFDRPVLYTDTEFDNGPYDAWWLEEEPWVFKVLPSLGEKLDVESLPRVKELIDTCLQDNKYAQGREQARRETWAHRGEGAKRVADYLVAKYGELQAKTAKEAKK